jgi:Zn-dependent protease
MMRWAAILFYLVVGGMVWGALGELQPAGGGLTIMLLTAVLSFIGTLVHELGHAFAAMRVGGRVIAIVVLPFELRFRPTRLGLAPRRKHRDLAGYVRYAPPPGMTRREAILVSAAGPLANFAFAPVALLLGAALAAWLGATGLPAPQSHTGLLPSDAGVLASIRHDHYLWAAKASQLLGSALAVLSAGMGAANLIPFGGSDGATIMRLMRSRRVA